MAELRFALSPRLYRPAKFFGPGVARLLRLVEQTGSLRTAAAEMNMAYSKAWKIINAAESGAGFPFLKSRTGGAGGGGATLTPEGADFLRRYERFADECQRAAQMLFSKYFADGEDEK